MDTGGTFESAHGSVYPYSSHVSAVGKILTKPPRLSYSSFILLNTLIYIEVTENRAHFVKDTLRGTAR